MDLAQLAMTPRSSTPAQLFGLVLVAGIAGFATGFFVRGGDRAPVRASGPSTGDVTVVRAGSAPVARDERFADVERPGTARSSGPSALQRDASDARIEAAVSSVAVPDVQLPSGDGVIRGKIETRDGEPVSEVSVFLVPPRPSVDVARSASMAMTDELRTRTLEETLADAAKRWSESEGLARETTTLGDGTFAFAKVPDRAFEVRAQRDGWIFERKTPQLVVPEEEVRFEAREMPSFELRLVASDGSAIDEALVAGGNVDGWMAWSRADPTVRVDEMPTQVRAVADVYELPVRYPVCSRLVSQSRPVTEETRSITLELEPTCVLAGTLSGDQHGRNLVFALQLREGASFDPTARLVGHESYWGSSGAFAFAELMPGRYAVGIVGDDDVPASHRIIEIGFGLNEIDLDKEEYDRSECIAVTTLTPSGKRARNPSYGLEWTREGSDPEREWLQTFTDIDGVDLVNLANLYSLDLDDIPAGTKIWLWATSSGYGKTRVPFSPGTREATLRFEDPCELEVAILGDIRGGGYTVVVQDLLLDRDDPPQLARATQKGSGGQTKINARGIVRFYGLRPGPVAVKLQRSMRWYGNGIPIEEAEVVLSGHEHRVEFQAQEMHDVQVTVTPTTKVRSVQLKIADEEASDGERNVMWSRSTDDGRLTFAALPPGEYTMIDSNTGARMDFSAPCPPIQWDLTGYVVRVSVSVSRQDGRLVEWGLMGGDEVTALNGKGIEEVEDILEHLHDAGATLTVERGGETLEIEVPRYPRDTRNANPLGGRFYIRT